MKHGPRKAAAKPTQKKLLYEVRLGLKKANPAAIVLWAFYRLPSKHGLTSRKIISFIKKRYTNVANPQKTGRSLSTVIKCAVEYGLLKKRGDKYYLAAK